MKRILLLLCALALLLSSLSGCFGTSGGDPADTSRQADTANTDPSENPTSGTETDPPAPSETRLRFLGAGDNIMHDAIIADARARADGAEGYNFRPMYNGIAYLIENADIAFINQEGPCGGAAYGYHGYPDFNAPDDVRQNLVDMGFDVINLANNHMLDCGTNGMIDTIKAFEALPVLTIGGYTQENYDTPRILERDGVKIAFLSYTTLINWAHMNDLSASSGYVIPYAKEDVITKQVQIAKEQADFVVVSMHWGDEDEFRPNAQQQNLAKLCADLGVDVVVGHHPHVVEPVEWISGANGGKTLVVYSLGNLINTMYYAQNMVGGMISFDFVKSPSGETSIENPLFIPTVCHYSMDRDALQVYRLEDYTEALAAQHGTNVHNAFSYAIAEKYITDNISPEFLPEFLK